MATVRPSNSDRATYRAKCRQKLSEHIRLNLGISIEPIDVRLITHAGDPYAWKALPEKQHLFQKHLSKHSISAYRELYRGVGVTFEAIAATESNEVAGIPVEKAVSRPSTTFTTVIEQLKEEKRNLASEIKESNIQIAKATRLKELAEEEVNRLASLLQASNMETQLLQQQVSNLTSMVEYLRNTTVNSVDEFINRLKFDLSIMSG